MVEFWNIMFTETPLELRVLVLVFLFALIFAMFKGNEERDTFSRRYKLDEKWRNDDK